LEVVRGGAVELDGVKLPPASIRLGGHNFEDDRVFLEAARNEARRLEAAFSAGTSTRFLDIGCGVGRLPIGLLSHFGALEDYTGIDVALPCIAWCERFIAQPGVRFVHLDLANERYNPRGTPIGADFRLRLADASFDVIYAYSVFSHMRLRDMQAYLREFHRLLAREEVSTSARSWSRTSKTWRSTRPAMAASPDSGKARCIASATTKASSKGWHAMPASRSNGSTPAPRPGARVAFT
jgi:SAM-dependent methyltransferase